MSGPARESSSPEGGDRAAVAFGPLAASADVLQLIGASTPVGIFVAGGDGGYEYVNQRWCDLTGLTLEEALGDGWRKALHPDDAAHVTASWTTAVEAGGDTTESYRVVRRDGTTSLVESHATALRGAAGDVMGWVGTCLDLTTRKAAEEALVAATERFRAAFENAPLGMGLVTPEGRWIQVNTELCNLLGTTDATLLETSVEALTAPGDPTLIVGDDQGRREARIRRSDGSTVWAAVRATLVRGTDDEPLYYVVQIEDIGEHKRTELELRRLADHDALTGLLNRRGFMEGMSRALRLMERTHETGALLVLDLDNFKLVNDTAGHLAGDQVLRAVANVLRSRLRSTDVIGRLGGDEFAALVIDVTTEVGERIAEQTRDALHALQVQSGDLVLEITASVGVIEIDVTTEGDEEELLAAADRAMYRAKHAGAGLRRVV